jgi:hypothetical protein
MPRFFFALTLILAALALTARALGDTQPPHPAGLFGNSYSEGLST